MGKQGKAKSNKLKMKSNQTKNKKNTNGKMYSFKICFCVIGIIYMASIPLRNQRKYLQSIVSTIAADFNQKEADSNQKEADFNQKEGSSIGLIPLPKLTHSGEYARKETVCPKGTEWMNNVVDSVAEKAEGRKIPKIVHMTGKSRCLTPTAHSMISMWKFENHSFYYHDDEAMFSLLLDTDFPMFPDVKNTLKCMHHAGNTAVADLWRYIALWEYGGIYTDIDNVPNTLFNASTLQDDTDAFFLQERGGFLSQFFFAVSPRHPVMFFAVHFCMNMILNMEDTSDFYVPYVTGPGAVKRAFIQFMTGSEKLSKEDGKKYSYPPAGHYVGPLESDRSVDVFAKPTTGYLWVVRDALRGRAKGDLWSAMNATSYNRDGNNLKKKSAVACMREIYRSHAGQ